MTRSRNYILSCLALLLTGLHAFAGAFISVKGADMIDTQGRPFIMKGINLGNWLVPEGYMFHFKNTNAPRQINEVISQLIGPDEAKAFWQEYLDRYITESDIRYLKSTGANSIRLPFHYKLFTKEDYLGSNDDTRGFRYVDSVVKWCRNAGLYLVLDMHCAPGGQTGDNIDDSYGYPFLFENEASRRQTLQIWQQIATHYKDEPVIIGYDLLNEPIAHYFDATKLNPYLEPFYKQLAQAIRTIDGNHIFFLGGAQWNTNFKIFGKPFDPKLVYTFHKYWCDTTFSVIKEYTDFRDKYQVPVYLGESGENTDQWVSSFRSLLDEHGVGWHFWPYKKMKNSRCMVTFAMPEGYDAIIAYAESNRESFEKIRQLPVPDRAEIKRILYQLLRNAAFSNCTANKGYVKALFPAHTMQD